MNRPGPGNPPNPQAGQARARIEQMKRQFEQRRAIESSLAGIKTKIGVYSGKGGVGKTTVAVNLAVALAQDGASVGILDVDIDCPNVVKAMKVAEPPEVGDDNRLTPPERFGVKVMSMGFFQKNEEEAIIWRGPMIHNAINQLLQTTDWGEMDYLLIDLPPGTSDSPLTVMQTITVDGFVVVTTPQELAKMDAMRSINMIRTLNVDVLGVVGKLRRTYLRLRRRRGAGEGDATPVPGPTGPPRRLPGHLPPSRPQQRDGAGGVPRNRLPDQGGAGQRNRKSGLAGRVAAPKRLRVDPPAAPSIESGRSLNSGRAVMITLHVYLSPKTGSEGDLVSATLEKWLPAMADQPGFVSCALVKPLPEPELSAMEAGSPPAPFEVVAFWRSEQERKEWVARPIHDEVFAPVLNAADSVSWTVQSVEGAWGV